jgi:putative aldouronate transport system substrate-binding protein
MKKLVLVTILASMFLMPSFASGAKEASPAAAGGSMYGTKENPVTVTYLCKDVNPNDAGMAQLAEEIEEGLAKQGKYINLEILEAPVGSYATVVPIAFRTGQISPDLIYFQGGDTAIAQEGMLEDLTPYIESSENVKSIMDQHNVERMKNYPYLLWLAPQRTSEAIVRGDWFNELDASKGFMDNPTPDNYYKLLLEMKNEGLCEWPLTVAGNTDKMDEVFNHAFGITSTLVKEDGKWVYSKVTEGEKNKLAFYAKLYKEGLLDNNYLTKNWETKEKAFYEGKSGMIIGTAGAVINIYNNKMIQTNGESSEGVVLPPAKGISQKFKSTDVTKETRGFAINADSTVKDAAWAVLDYMASPEGRVIDILGLKGVSYNMEGGKYVLTDSYSSWWSRFWGTLNGLDMSKVEGEIMSQPAYDSLTLMNEYFAPDTNVLLPEDLLPLKDAMDKLYIEYSTEIIRGNKPISDFDEFVTKWNAAGGDEIGTYIATQLD